MVSSITFFFTALMTTSSSAFLVNPSPQPSNFVSSKLSCSLKVTNDTIPSTTTDVDDKKKEKGSSYTSLRFGGSKIYKSKPIPLTKDMNKFFESEKTKQILLGGGKQAAIERINDDEVLNNLNALWEKRCQSFSEALLPSIEEGDAIYSVPTSDMKFPGLTLSSKSLIGTKIITDTDEKTFPQYQFVLIKDETFPRGSKIVLWIYNKLTGNDKVNRDENSTQKVESFTRVSVQEISESEGIFTLNASLNITVEFPSLLLKILPVSKEKAEQQGSESVMKLLDKELNVVLEKLHESYMKSIHDRLLQ